MADSTGSLKVPKSTTHETIKNTGGKMSSLKDKFIQSFEQFLEKRPLLEVALYMFFIILAALYLLCCPKAAGELFPPEQE